MIVSHRINARKVVVTYYYLRCFVQYTMNKDSILRDVVSIDGIYDPRESYDVQLHKIQEDIKHHYDRSEERRIDYILQQYFSKIPKEQIDYAYIREMVAAYEQYEPQVASLVDAHTTSFTYDQMDVADRAIFILAIAEHAVFQTPKEVLLNEVIELAKRYGDDGSTRLVNALVHKILSWDWNSPTKQ